MKRPILDDFRGDNAHLCRCIEAEINLSDRNALVPHGLGGNARALLAAALRRIQHAEDVVRQMTDEASDLVGVEGPQGPRVTVLMHYVGQFNKRLPLPAAQPAPIYTVSGEQLDACGELLGAKREPGVTDDAFRALLIERWKQMMGIES